MKVSQTSLVSCASTLLKYELVYWRVHGIHLVPSNIIAGYMMYYLHTKSAKCLFITPTL